MRQLLARLTTPTGFLLAGLCFLLPFAAVSCEAPGGYGRAAPGATTTYSGLTLAVGGVPKVDKPTQLLPKAQRKEDELPPQPFAIVSLALIIVGLLASIVLYNRRSRFPVAAAVSTLATVLVIANQAIVEASLESRLQEQLRVAMPAGKHPTDYVNTGSGFGLCLLILAGLVLGSLIGWARRPPPPRAVPIPFQSRREMRARGEVKAAEKAARIAARLAARTGDGSRTDPTPTPTPVLSEPWLDDPLLPVDPVAAPDRRADEEHHGPPGVDPWPDAPV
ncbi:hypothetical protein F4553_002946 [Allocatelliglobosispora scoriae]|uniref:Uncharacterized protein n=1 Tax=Allocatelliglobosispora scoriae TaxID=643052 RepID=A0A841BKE3_9ACTN|nr:hypothetical protein [Allocatelliglobosispora scoriae]MBB5869567.1 hypothetical protein [Allocatelliglobosispora scoriae]